MLHHARVSLNSISIFRFRQLPLILKPSHLKCTFLLKRLRDSWLPLLWGVLATSCTEICTSEWEKTVLNVKLSLHIFVISAGMASPSSSQSMNLWARNIPLSLPWLIATSPAPLSAAKKLLISDGHLRQRARRIILGWGKVSYSFTVQSAYLITG